MNKKYVKIKYYIKSIINPSLRRGFAFQILRQTYNDFFPKLESKNDPFRKYFFQKIVATNVSGLSQGGQIKHFEVSVPQPPSLLAPPHFTPTHPSNLSIVHLMPSWKLGHYGANIFA